MLIHGEIASPPQGHHHAHRRGQDVLDMMFVPCRVNGFPGVNLACNIYIGLLADLYDSESSALSVSAK